MKILINLLRLNTREKIARAAYFESHLILKIDIGDSSAKLINADDFDMR